MGEMFGLAKKDTPFGVIIDVHSGSVGMAIVHSEPGMDLPQVLYAHREYLKIGEHPDTSALIRALRQALFSASLQLASEGMAALKTFDPKGSLGRVLLVCGAPWANTVTRFIHVEDKEPFLVTQERVRTLIEEAERRDETELKTASLLRELNIGLVERAIVNTALNGYPTHDPYGKKGTELSLAHISGLVPQAIIDTATEIEDKILPDTVRTSHTFALVLFCVMRDLYPDTHHGLFMDISGEATELCLMQDEVLMETCVFPFGTHTFLRLLASELNTFPDEALTHMREFGQATPESIKLAVAKVSEQYVTSLAEAIGLLEERYSIPSHIFLSTSRGLHTHFDTLIRQAVEKYIGAHGTFLSLNTDLIAPQQDALKTNDIFFYLEARFFHKLHACGDVT